MAQRKIEIYRDVPRRMKKLFGVPWVPSIPFDRTHWPEEVRKLAGKMSLSGVQQKASVRLNKKAKQIELAQGDGAYILKPDPPEYLDLSRVESLCMDIAEELGFDVPPHGVLVLADGTPAYIVKRFDRNPDGSKIHKEDMAQLLGLPTDEKYESSIEKVGKGILANTTNSYLDLLNFFERVLFNFVIGNGDMHLKNWAVLVMRNEKGGGPKVKLAPCYDFVSSKIFISNEEESALTINGKRNKLDDSDFEALASFLDIDERATENVLEKLLSSRSTMIEMVRAADLSQDKKAQLENLFTERINRLAEKVPGAEEENRGMRRKAPRVRMTEGDAERVVWFSQKKSEASAELKQSGFPSDGSMIFTSFLATPQRRFPLEELNQAARDSQISTFGWPIGIYLDSEEYRPRPDTEGVKATVLVTRSDAERSFDYWYLRRNGDYIVLTSLFEDQRSNNKVFLDTRIVRITETFLHTALLYEKLGIDPRARVNMEFTHGGLRGRELTFANAARILSTVRKSGADIVVSHVSSELGEIRPRINDLVYDVVSGIAEMFEFFKPSKLEVVDPIVDAFVSGRIG